MTLTSDQTALSSSLEAEKAAWYREVLELEPGSKVFLPFARLLAGMGRQDEAVAVLRDGLERHPEFMEARLFLIDVLHKSGDAALCGAEVARLAGLFRSHPDFWEAWSALSEAEGDKPDMAVSLGFLGALFRDGEVTLVDVLAAGLKALRDSSGLAAESVAAPRDGASAASAAGSPATTPVSPSGFIPETAPASSEAPAEFTSGDFPPEEAAVPSLPAFALPFVPSGLSADEAPLPFVFDGDALLPPAAVVGSAHEAVPASAEPGQEKCSLRTRSMAEVLAEQGDVRGAVDIYEELLATCRPVDRAALESRLESLRARLGEETGPLPVQHATASSPARSVPANKSRNGVLDLLEKLAVRLETKARQ